jgi:histone H3/H4
VPSTAVATANANANDDEVLVVVSKLKKYIRDQSGMSTSDGSMPVLSNHLRALARQAIRHATEEGRKTVMDRDFLPFLNERK